MTSTQDLEILPDEVEFGMILDETGDNQEDRSRQRNFGKSQHRKFTGYDQKLPMVIYGYRKETVHGTSADGRPHSLVVFRWALQQRKRGKRFKSAQLKAVFATARTKDHTVDGGRDAYYDPHVVTVEPKGTYSLLSTPVTVVRTQAAEAGFEGGLDLAKGTAKVVYNLSKTTNAADQIVINGTECNEYDAKTAAEVKDPDRCNVVEWQLFENAATRSGLPSFFQTAVLLERRSGDTGKFTATFTVRAEIGSMTDAWTSFKRFAGLIPRDDPIIFDPSIDEHGRLAAFKDRLDTVPLADECKFVMFQNDEAPVHSNIDESDGEDSVEEDPDTE